MTDHTTAAQAALQTVLTEADRHQLLARANYPHLLENPRTYLVKITEDMVLSKLRAPVADERAAFEASYRSRFNVPAHAALTFPDVPEAWKWWQRRAALASAPVADKRAGNVIDAADSYAEKYQGDDRQDIGIDVRNAFMQGVAWASDLVDDARKDAIWKLLDDLQSRAKEAKRFDDFDDLSVLGLMIHKASAPVAGEAKRNTGNTVLLENQALAAPQASPVAGEAQEDLAPPKCPITGRPFFMALEHPELGMVPTYGGPYDSYTIPHLGGKPDQPWHERDLRVYRYDHDLGGWIADETEVIPLRIVHEDVLHGLEDAAPQASEAQCSCPSGDGSLRCPCAVHGAAVLNRDEQRLAVWQAIQAITIGNLHDDKLIVANLNAAGYVISRAALSAQPGAQMKGCTCTACRPHSVEMRMILCEVCGDKRCPHAADHRNACTGAHPDNKDGGAVYG